jgi:hypothetical protein
MEDVLDLYAEEPNPQAQAAIHTKETADKIIRELNQLAQAAQAKEAYGAAVSAVLGKAKILSIGETQALTTQDYKAARSMTDIGRKLLQSVGLSAPDDASIAAAVELNNAFVAGLERIRDQAEQTISAV